MTVLIKVTGPDHPGITAALTGILAEHQVRVLDIEQVVVHGQLILCFLVGLDAGTPQAQLVLKELLFCAKGLGQNLDFTSLAAEKEPEKSQKQVSRYALTLLGDPISTEALSRASRVLAKGNANIESIRQLSNQDLHSLEMSLALPAQPALVTELKNSLMQELSETGVDIALQRERLARRSKRLVVMDMDSTLIAVEVIDELAKMHGVFDAVKKITDEAMRGGMEFKDAFARRIALLAGMNTRGLSEFANQLPLNPGASTLIRVLKNLGYRIGVVSGGFQFAANALQQRLGLDYAFANPLDIEQEKLTGKVIGNVIDAQRKADILQEIANTERITLEQTIAIGDGANDALMLAKAGLGIAFHAKPLLKKSADTSVSSGGLERILHFLGMSAKEIQEYHE